MEPEDINATGDRAAISENVIENVQRWAVAYRIFQQAWATDKSVAEEEDE